ncbi:MAG: radical SAM protein, partial [Saccharospirillum sp.]
MTKKLFIKTHGCQMNEYDSSRMADLLGDSHGYTLTDNADEADVLLLNTCSIREKAQDKVFHQLGRWKKLKAKNPHLKIGVGGCVASQEGQAISDRAPYVDMIFGPQTLHRLPQMLDASTGQIANAAGNRIAMVDVTFPEIEKFDHLPAPKSDGVSAFVSVMEGCSKYCTFCVVPYTRGEEVSRPFDDVITEVVQLSEQGVREINFLGQNVNAYRGPRHDGGEADLAELITLAAR